jgi:hypothetical protein
VLDAKAGGRFSDYKRPSRRLGSCRVFIAARTLSLLHDTRRAQIVGRPEGPKPPLPDTRGFALDAAAVLPLDAAAAALCAEGWICAALRLPRARLEQARAKHPVVFREESQPLALQGIRSVVGSERNAPRREAVLAAYTARLGDVARSSRAVVDALRGAFDALPAVLREVHAPAADDVDALLGATDDLWRELDLRVLRGLELDPGRLTWGDRLRSFAGPSLLREVPPATWSALSLGWWSRVGLEAALRGVGDHLGASSSQGEGVYALVDAAEGRALLLGRPAPSAWDAAEVLGAGSVCAGAMAARGLWSAHRRGVDRFADGVLHALGRRLAHEKTFLQRAAQLDGLARERVRVESLHAVLRERLRARYDEDWHRNPHAGEWLRATLDGLRVEGLRGEAVGACAGPRTGARSRPGMRVPSPSMQAVDARGTRCRRCRPAGGLASKRSRPSPSRSMSGCCGPMFKMMIRWPPTSSSRKVLLPEPPRRRRG